ncbi:MAG: hypothetical protein OIF34_10645, partial [Porticoccaceae bacterium]|nr:hypothetical protein [Porticoccaceae bacterium]
TVDHTVRSYVVPGGKAPQVEVAGAKCKLDAPEFSMAFTTPAKVKVPLVKGKMNKGVYSCTYRGKENKLDVKAFLYGSGYAGGGYYDASQSAGANASANIIAALIVGVASGAIATARDRWAYPIGSPKFEMPVPADVQQAIDARKAAAAEKSAKK